jgi:hypothetical protein
MFAAAAAAFVTVLTLGAAEIALRIADYPPASFSPWIRSDTFGFRLAPGISVRMRGPEYDVEIATNSLGLRDDEPAKRSELGERPRVLLLGDSFAMGYGVERGRLFADRLEQILPADVVNAGTGGYEIIQQPRVLAELGPKLEPDAVVYALYLGNDLAQNDEWEVRGDGTLHNLVRTYPVRQPREIKLARLVRDAAYGVRKGRSEKEGEWLPFDGYLGLCERTLGAAAKKDYDDATALLGSLAGEAKKLGVPLLVLMLPYRSMVEADAIRSLERRIPDLNERYDLSQPAREIGARMTSLGITHADVTPFLVAEHARSGEPLFFPIDGHLTPAGHDAVARFAAPRIRDILGAPDAPAAARARL